MQTGMVCIGTVRAYVHQLLAQDVTIWRTRLRLDSLRLADRHANLPVMCWHCFRANFVNAVLWFRPGSAAAISLFAPHLRRMPSAPHTWCHSDAHHVATLSERHLITI